jgi:hypothetical protein
MGITLAASIVAVNSVHSALDQRGALPSGH